VCLIERIRKKISFVLQGCGRSSKRKRKNREKEEEDVL
jgi:hypothetical protein